MTEMKFLSGAKSRSITYVIEASRTAYDPLTQKTHVVPGLRAEFLEHEWDSEGPGALAQYRAYSQYMSDHGKPMTEAEVQEKCERYIQDHGDWGRADGRGIFFGNLGTIQELELRAKGIVKRCIFEQDAGDGKTSMCNEVVDDPTQDFCEVHQKKVEAALASLQGQRETATVGASEEE